MNAEEAQNAAELCEHRKELHERASRLLSDDVGLCVTDGKDVLEIDELHREFHALLRREYEAQLATIDEDLQALGITPEPLERPPGRDEIILRELREHISSPKRR